MKRCFVILMLVVALAGMLVSQASALKFDEASASAGNGVLGSGLTTDGSWSQANWQLCLSGNQTRWYGLVRYKRYQLAQLGLNAGTYNKTAWWGGQIKSKFECVTVTNWVGFTTDEIGLTGWDDHQLLLGLNRVEVFDRHLGASYSLKHFTDLSPEHWVGVQASMKLSPQSTLRLEAEDNIMTGGKAFLVKVTWKP